MEPEQENIEELEIPDVSSIINIDEKVSNTIADNIGVKYVITDIEMDTGKFWAMATWCFNMSRIM